MLNIKEIALKIADSLRNKVDGISHMQSNQGLVVFAEALISAYKDEVMKLAGEPVAYFSDEFFSINTKQNATFNDPLYTSDQVAAAILKVTKPLKEEVARYRGKSIADADRTEAYLYENQELRAQLATAQEEIQRMKRERLLTADAIESLHASQKDQLAKAEQRVAEWQPISTAPKDGQSYLAYSTEFVNQYWVTDKCNGMTHWMPLPKAPANGASS